MTTKENPLTVPEVIDFHAARVERFRAAFAEKGYPMPPAPVCRLAIAGILNKRTGRLLSNPRTLAADPLGSVLRRTLDWHRGSGNLWGAYAVRGDCDWIQRKAAWDPTRSFADEIDTLALILLNGKSQASDNWRRVLGIQPAS